MKYMIYTVRIYLVEITIDGQVAVEKLIIR
jgi:hypothetical protein